MAGFSIPCFRLYMNILCLTRFSRQLSTMPDGNNPDIFFFNTVKKTVRGKNHFTERKIWKFWQCPAGLRKFSEPGQDLFCPASESDCRCRAFAEDICNGCKELAAPRRGKKDVQGFVSFNKESASARTTLRSYPLPASISFSPRARRRKSSSSCRECS